MGVVRLFIFFNLLLNPAGFIHRRTASYTKTAVNIQIITILTTAPSTSAIKVFIYKNIEYANQHDDNQMIIGQLLVVVPNVLQQER
jgi:hypothetical protein